MIFAQGVPGGGIGPVPAPTPGQSISIGPGSLGGGFGPAPAPTPGQSFGIAPGNLGGGIGPAPAPTPGQSITLAPNTRRGRGRGATPRLSPDQTINPAPRYLPYDNRAIMVNPGLRQTFRTTSEDRAEPRAGESGPRHKHPKKCVHGCLPQR